MALKAFLCELLPEVISDTFVHHARYENWVFEGFEDRILSETWPYLLRTELFSEEQLIRNWHLFDEVNVEALFEREGLSFSFIRDFLVPHWSIWSDDLWRYHTLRNEELAICLSLKAMPLGDFAVIGTRLPKPPCIFREKVLCERILQMDADEVRSFFFDNTTKKNLLKVFFRYPSFYLSQPEFTFLLSSTKKINAFVSRYHEALSGAHWKEIARSAEIPELDGLRCYCPEIFSLYQNYMGTASAAAIRRYRENEEIFDLLSKISAGQGTLKDLNVDQLQFIVKTDDKLTNKYLEEAYTLIATSSRADLPSALYFRKRRGVSLDFILQYQDILPLSIYEDLSLAELEEFLTQCNNPEGLAGMLHDAGPMDEDRCRVLSRYSTFEMHVPRNCSEAFLEEFFEELRGSTPRLSLFVGDRFVRRHWNEFVQCEVIWLARHHSSPSLILNLARNPKKKFLEAFLQNPCCTVNFARKLLKQFPEISHEQCFENEWTKQREIESNVLLVDEVLGDIKSTDDSLVIAVLTITRDVEEVIVAERHLLR